MDGLRLPNFIFIGADRCGSKWLHHILSQHEQIFVPKIADPYFFDREYDRGMDWYGGLFAEAGQAPAVGELSHDYIHSPLAAQRIRKHLPDVKIVATLRHPAEKSFSSYQSAVNAGVFRGSFEEALADQPFLIHNSSYHSNLKPYYELFPASQIKVLRYDQLSEDPAGYAAEVFKFIGVPFDPAIDYGTVVNPLSKSVAGIGGTLSKRAANALRSVGLVRVLGRAKTSPFVRRFFYKAYDASERPTIKPETRARLAKLFAPEIDGLERQFGFDLSSWRQ